MTQKPLIRIYDDLEGPHPYAVYVLSDVGGDEDGYIPHAWADSLEDVRRIVRDYENALNHTT